MYKLISLSWLALTGTLLLVTLTPKLVLSQNSANTTSSVSTQEQVDDSNTQKQADHHSGIKGIVIISPISPVARPGVINYRPYQATITVLDQFNQIVTQFQSDKNGYFQVSLEPGTYTLRPESPQVYPRAPEVTITVSENKFTKVKITYDSGIR